MRTFLLQFLMVSFLFSTVGLVNGNARGINQASGKCRSRINKEDKQADPKTIVGKDVTLAIVTSNLDSCTIEFALIVNESEEVIGAKLKYTHENDPRSPEYYLFSQFNNDIVLKEVVSGSKTYKVVILRGKDFQQFTKTNYKLDYMTNGLTGNRSTLDLTLDYNSGWALYYKGRKVKGFYFKKKSVFGKVVGVKEIKVLTKE